MSSRTIKNNNYKTLIRKSQNCSHNKQLKCKIKIKAESMNKNKNKNIMLSDRLGR